MEQVKHPGKVYLFRFIRAMSKGNYGGHTLVIDNMVLEIVVRAAGLCKMRGLTPQEGAAIFYSSAASILGWGGLGEDGMSDEWLVDQVQRGKIRRSLPPELLEELRETFSKEVDGPLLRSGFEC